MTHDDDFLSAPVPEPLDEASPSERAHAKTFADIVDKALTGRAPAAMSADDRALLEVATVIRAANGQVSLAASTQRSIVEAALAQAIGGTAATTSGPITPIATARGRRWVPWAIGGGSTLIAAAAALALWLRGPAVRIERTETAAVPASWQSRPADPLIGAIDREHAGDASARIDTLFADRLEGYRERRLSARSGGNQ